MEREDNREEDPSRGSSTYQRWLAEKSCSEYRHEERQGTVNSEASDKIDFMCSKKIKLLLLNCELAIFLVTEDGEVYYWCNIGWNNTNIVYYSQYIDLRNTRFIQTTIGINRTLIAQTDDKKVYFFETESKNSNLRGWMRRLNLSKKVISISCGNAFFVVVADDGTVYSWGMNDRGQLGVSTSENFTLVPQEIKVLANHNIVKVVCGQLYTLALSGLGNIYVWGGNSYGELGCLSTDDIRTPTKIPLFQSLKALDVTAMKNMSCVIGEDRLFYVWGSCFGQQIRTPIVCEYTTLFDISNALCAREPTKVKDLNTEKPHEFFRNIANAFNNSEDSDLVIKVKERSIYVHKYMLQIRTKHFKKINQFIVIEGGQNVIKLNDFPYAIYYAFFKYLYTCRIELPLEQIFELISFIDSIKEEKFEQYCYKEIKKKMTVNNVISIYNLAKEYNKKPVQEECLVFFNTNKEEAKNTDSFLKLSEGVKNIFLAEPSQSNRGQ